jgi:hypothetical protein
MLSEDLSVEVIPLLHCIVLLPLDFVPLPLLFVPLPHFFIPLPQSLLKHFNLLPFFQAVRDEATPPCALRRRCNLLSSHLPGVNYAI